MSNLTKWLDSRNFSSNLLPPFSKLQTEIDDLFRNFYHAFPNVENVFTNLVLNPAIDILEDNTSFKIEVEMPGIDEKDIKVNVSDGDYKSLTIKAEKKTSSKNDNKKYSMREISYGSYERVIPLPDSVDLDKAKTTFKKGMLWVEIPKKEGYKGNSRELKVESGFE